jgi:hypothetical protein
MTLAIVLVVAAVVALTIILRLVVSRSLQYSDGSNPVLQIRPIDIAAFRNLIDPAEDDYLRRRLPAAEFRHVRRARLRATAAYVQVASSNAAVLIRIGEAALASADPSAALAARELINQALLLRRNTALALAKIYLVMAWPTYGLAAERLADHYDRLGRSAMLLGRLQNPAVPVRISAAR